MPGAEQYKAQQFIDVIPGTAGIISTISRRVGCAWGTAKKYIEKYATVKKVYQDECESMLDLAELEALKLIKGGDGSMIRWYLSTKGKDRGYAERRELTGAGGEPLFSFQNAVAALRAADKFLEIEADGTAETTD